MDLLNCSAMWHHPARPCVAARKQTFLVHYFIMRMMYYYNLSCNQKKKKKTKPRWSFYRWVKSCCAELLHQIQWSLTQTGLPRSYFMAPWTTCHHQYSGSFNAGLISVGTWRKCSWLVSCLFFSDWLYLPAHVLLPLCIFSSTFVIKRFSLTDKRCKVYFYVVGVLLWGTLWTFVISNQPLIHTTTILSLLQRYWPPAYPGG